MGTFRVHKTKDYTVMSNNHLRNKEMTLKAKGLLSQMLSLPDDWNYTIEGLASINKEGVDCISDTLTELEKFGYVTRKRIRDEKGRLRGTDYDIYEEPIREKPILDNPVLEKPEQAEPEQEKPGLLNTNKQITEEENTDYIKYSSNPIPSLESFPCESGNVDNTETGRERKGQKINNYDLWERQIKTNIDYESFCCLRRVLEFPGMLISIQLSDRKTIKSGLHVFYVFAPYTDYRGLCLP